MNATELAEKLLAHSKSRYLQIDNKSFTGIFTDAVLEISHRIFLDSYKIFADPICPQEIQNSEQDRIKLNILSKILGTYSFSFPRGSDQKYLGILEENIPPPGNVSHGIPEEDPGGQILPTAGTPIAHNVVSVEKPEFKTLLIGQSLLKGGIVNYDGLLRHTASFLESPIEKIHIEVIEARKVVVRSKLEVTDAKSKVYNTFFAGIISHIGISIRLEANS